MSNEYENLNIEISAEFDGNISSQQILPESKAECAVKGTFLSLISCLHSLQ